MNMMRVIERGAAATVAASPAPLAYHPTRDMPRCQWYGQHRWNGIGTEHCMDCGTSREAFRAKAGAK